MSPRGLDGFPKRSHSCLARWSEVPTGVCDIAAVYRLGFVSEHGFTDCGKTQFASFWEGHDFQSCRKARKINAALAAEVRSWVLKTLFPQPQLARVVLPVFPALTRLCENSKTLNRDRTSYSFEIGFRAHIASQFNFEIELENIILVALRVFEFSHSLGQKAKNSD